MNKKYMIDKIYEVIADKTQSNGCIIEHKDGKRFTSSWIWSQLPMSDKIIWHPVMIGDVFNWIDYNCNRIDNWDWNKSRNIDRHRDLIVQIYYYFINWLNKPIDNQSEDSILFIYNLIYGTATTNS